MKKISDLVKNKKFIWTVIALWGIILISLHFTRIIDNNFWKDEYYSISLGNMSFWDLTYATAHDVHPPLYYMILKVFILIFGNYGWVYHLVSLVPFILMVIVSLTVVWKDFGASASLILITLCGTMNNAMLNIIEVRDYEWAALFMLLSFLYAFRLFNYRSYSSGRIKNTILLVVFSLLAAYTFYFCIIAIAVIYIALMIFALKNKDIFKNVLLTWAFTFLAYLPWCIVFFLTLGGNQGKIFSFNSVGLIDCVKDIFSTNFSYILLAIFLIISILILVFEKEKAYKLWTLSGILAYIITALIPYIISIVFSPIFTSKHLYPVDVIPWILLAVNVTRINLGNKKIIKSILVAVILVLTIPVGILGLRRTLIEENRINEKLNKFLELTNEMIIEDNPVILSNEDMISLGIGKYYFPDSNRIFFDGTEKTNEPLEENLPPVIMMINQVDYENSEEMLKYCQDLGYKCERLIDRVFFGNYVVDLWKCTLP